MKITLRDALNWHIPDPNYLPSVLMVEDRATGFASVVNQRAQVVAARDDREDRKRCRSIRGRL
jgi:hypothetical protein